MCAIFAKDVRHPRARWRISFKEIEPIPAGDIH